MPREDFVCALRLRVRRAEPDLQKIVFNGHHLTYIDAAIAKYRHEIGLPCPAGEVGTRARNDVPTGAGVKGSGCERIAPQG